MSTDVPVIASRGFALGENPRLADLCDPGRAPKNVAEPFRDFIVAGKNTYVYDAHTYHTKVPPDGIARCIEYYTRPGDVILDPFCGSGMTGVAALGLERAAILSDLSPAAAFIAHNLCSPIDPDAYRDAVAAVLAELKPLEHRLYDTTCRTCGRATPMLYTVWSYGLICSSCEHEFIFWDVGRDERARVRDSKIPQRGRVPTLQRFGIEARVAANEALPRQRRIQMLPPRSPGIHGAAR